MKPMKLLLATQQAIAEDEYDYRAFPTAEQIA
ncbi:OmpA family protein, partial [Vibrio parahaemolyticus]|nr:OmpA family protein [Vibrio parahaemolyticus]